MPFSLSQNPCRAALSTRSVSTLPTPTDAAPTSSFMILARAHTRVTTTAWITPFQESKLLSTLAMLKRGLAILQPSSLLCLVETTLIVLIQTTWALSAAETSTTLSTVQSQLLQVPSAWKLQNQASSTSIIPR